jgi:hypothetical protein
MLPTSGKRNPWCVQWFPEARQSHYEVSNESLPEDDTLFVFTTGVELVAGIVLGPGNGTVRALCGQIDLAIVLAIPVLNGDGRHLDQHDSGRIDALRKPAFPRRDSQRHLHDKASRRRQKDRLPDARSPAYAKQNRENG